MVSEDMDRALTLALEEQKSDVISQDTIRTFNSHLQIVELRGRATLAVDTRGRKFQAYAHCSEATIFSLSDQRPATILWALTGFWAILIWYRRQHVQMICTNNSFGGLTYSEEDSRFYATDGHQVQLTPMQHQLMELFMAAPDHRLGQQDICDHLWPKKPDASATLYTLIRRLKNILDQATDITIECQRSESYQLITK